MKTSVQERSGIPRWWIERQITWELRKSSFRFRKFAYDSVGVQGDARVVGPTVIIVPLSSATTAEAGIIATDLINRVPGITRVLVEIPLNVQPCPRAGLL